jgi:hypothetical protein
VVGAVNRQGLRGAGLSPASPGQGAQDLFLFREAALLVLGEDQLAVDDDVELARRPGDEGGVDADLVLDGRRETRGAGFVVSDLAVFDLDGVRHDPEDGAARRLRQGRAFLSLAGPALWHPPSMRFALPCVALGCGLALALACVAFSCTNPGGAGGAGGSTGTGGGLGGGDAASPAVAACATCLDSACAPEKNACGATSDCVAIQACIDAVCFNLSATASADEGPCQVRCQALHPDGIAQHLAYVNCAQGTTDAGTAAPVPDGGVSTCVPPCVGYPYDYDWCVAEQNAGGCQPALAACQASTGCTAYRACAGGCTTLAACEACAASPGGAAGETLYEAYQLCLDTTCLAQGWLPHL